MRRLTHSLAASALAASIALALPTLACAAEGNAASDGAPAPAAPAVASANPSDEPAESPAGTPSAAPSATPTETPAAPPIETPSATPTETPAEGGEKDAVPAPSPSVTENLPPSGVDAPSEGVDPSGDKGTPAGNKGTPAGEKDAATGDDEAVDSPGGSPAGFTGTPEPTSAKEPTAAAEKDLSATAPASQATVSPKAGSPAATTASKTASVTGMAPSAATRSAADRKATTPAAATPAAATPAASATPSQGTALSTSAAASAGQATRSSDDRYYAPDEVCDLYRLYNPYSGEHFYTESAVERDHLSSIGWNDEGVGWTVPTKRGTPVHRLYNPFAGDHHYTTSDAERDSLVSVGWNYEGTAWLSADFSRLSVWRAYNPNTQVGTHHYTLSEYEYNSLASIGWSGESVGFYAVDPSFVRERTSTDFSQGVTSIKATVAAGDGSNAATIASTLAHDTIYLFLPSYANARSVRLAAFGPNGKSLALALSGDTTNYRSVDAKTPVDLNSFGAEKSPEGGLAFKCKEGVSATKFIHDLVVMFSANVSSVFVDSNDVAKAGRAYIEASKDHSAKAKVAVSVVDAKGATVYGEDKLGTENLSSIKGRGNMTWTNGDKKPYQISLNKKADLLQTGVKDNKNKKWILLANMNDPSLLRNTVAYDLGLELGLVGMEGTPVDLYYDGEYRGSYYLCEKTEVKKGRVDVSDLEEELEKANPGVDLESLPTARAKNSLGYEYQYVRGAKSPDDVTGGYLVELDKTYYVSQTCWFDTKIGHFSIKVPEACSKECMEYISVAFETALENYEKGVFNAEKDFSFDLDSFAKSYFVAEFLKNVDSYHSSTYFYVDKGSKTIFSGPIWDFDGSAGIRNEGPLEMSHVAYEGFNLWNAGIFEKSVPMRERLTELYQSTIRPLIDGVLLGGETAVGSKGYLHSMSYYLNQVRASQRMNEVLYGLDGWVNILKAFSTYEENYAYLRNWLKWRSGWWTRNIAKLTKDVSYPRPTYGGFDYSAVFDASYYLATCADARKYAPDGNAQKALEHFVKYGMAKGLSGSANFDVKVYRMCNEDLQKDLGNDLRAYYEHYCTYGIFQGRVGWR